MQTIAADEDIGLTTNYSTWKRLDTSAGRRRVSMRIVLEGLLGVGLLLSLCWVVALSVRVRALNTGVKLSPECLHALGGGQVSPGGSIHPAVPAYCRGQLAVYADPIHGAYWKEVELAAQNAMEVFGFSNSSLLAQHSGSTWGNSLLLVQQALSHRKLLGVQAAAAAADGLATARLGLGLVGPSLAGSNEPNGPQSINPSNNPIAAQTPPPAAAPLALPDASGDAAVSNTKKKVVVFDIDETMLSNMQQILNPEDWPWDTWVQAAQAPALKPVQQFYRALCTAGYSVVLVTGRREASRQSTTQNLAAAGYGGLCAGSTSRNAAQDSPSSSSSSSSALHAGTNPTTTSSSGKDSVCCYDALYMRPKNDTRLASVYKPGARQQLLANGEYELVALVGDQFSDLNGEYSAPFAFKLPNPFYWIL